jgi:hypothetical protein
LSDLIHPGGILSQAGSCQQNERREAVGHAPKYICFSIEGTPLADFCKIEDRLRKTSPLEFSFSRYREALLGPRLQQTKLVDGQVHFLADLPPALLFQIEAFKDFPITPGEASKDPADEVHILAVSECLLRISSAIGNPRSFSNIQYRPPPGGNLPKMSVDSPMRHCSHETHQAFGFAQAPKADGLHDD